MRSIQGGDKERERGINVEGSSPKELLTKKRSKETAEGTFALVFFPALVITELPRSGARLPLSHRREITA